MSSRLTDVLIGLSQDPFLAEQLKRDPSRFVGSDGLDSNEIALLAGGDADKLDAYLAAAKKKPIKPTNKKPAQPVKPTNRKTLKDWPEF